MGASQGRAGCGLRVSRGQARTFENKPLIDSRPHLEDFGFAHTANNGSALWRPFDRDQGGGRQERSPNESGKRAVGRNEALASAGNSRGANTSTSPPPHGRVVVNDGPMQPVPSNTVDVPAMRFGTGDMVMVANLLAHPESLLKVGRGVLAATVDFTPVLAFTLFRKGTGEGVRVVVNFHALDETLSK